MVALAAALLVLGKTGTVTLTVRARPLKEVCAVIGEATGYRLDVKGKLQDEIVILHVKEVEPGPLMDRLAEVVHAQWGKVSEGHYELSRPAIFEKRERDQHVARIAKQIMEAREAAAKRSKLDTPLDAERLAHLLRLRKQITDQEAATRITQESYQRRRAVEDQLPQQRGLLRLINLIPATDLASIEPNSAVVFATEPTKMQLPPPPGWQAAIESYRNEREMLRSASTSSESEQSRGVFSPDRPSGNLIPWRKDASVTVKIGYASFGGLTAQLRVYDQQGRLVEQTSGSVVDLPEQVKPVTLPKDVSVEFSPESKAVSEALRAGATYGRRGAKSPDARTIELLTRTREHDPLSFSLSDALIQAADANHCDLIALPDDDFFYADLNHREDKRASLYFGHLAMRTNVAFDGAWMTATPVDRYLTRLQRADRDATGKYLSARAKLGYTALQNKLDLATATPFPRQPSNTYFFELALGPSIRSFDSGPKAFRFFASLSAEQRQSLLAGGKLASANLVGQQRDLLEDWVFRSMDESMLYQKENNLYTPSAKLSEATTAIGEGLTRPFFVSATVTQRDVAICYDGFSAFSMDPLTLAMNMARCYYVEEGESEWPEPVGFRNGSDTHISLRVEFEPGLVTMAQLSGLDVDMSGDPGTIDILPKGFRTAYEKELAKAIETLKKIGAKPTGRTAPPPP